MRIHVVQYVRPHGIQRDQIVDKMPDDLKPLLKIIESQRWRLAAEVLTTGEVSFTVEDSRNEEDVDIEIAENGPGSNGTKAALEKLIRRVAETIKYHDDGCGIGWGA